MSRLGRSAFFSARCVRGGGKRTGRPLAATWNSATGSGNPRRRWSPSVRKRTPSGADPVTASRVAPDTRICPPWAAAAMRAAVWTGRPM